MAIRSMTRKFFLLALCLVALPLWAMDTADSRTMTSGPEPNEPQHDQDQSSGSASKKEHSDEEIDFDYQAFIDKLRLKFILLPDDYPADLLTTFCKDLTEDEEDNELNWLKIQVISDATLCTFKTNYAAQPMKIALAKESPELLLYLLSQGFNPNTQVELPAVQNTSFFARILSGLGFSSDEPTSCSLLEHAIDHQNTWGVDALLNNDYGNHAQLIPTSNLTLLQRAVLAGSPEIVRLLVSKQSNTAKELATALELARRKNKPDIVRLLENTTTEATRGHLINSAQAAFG